jgi:formylglycine-generating enzyme required for sulfatase activity
MNGHSFFHLALSNMYHLVLKNRFPGKISRYAHHRSCVKVSVILLIFSMSFNTTAITISGTVIDTDSIGIEGADVRLIGTGDSTTTGADGAFTLTVKSVSTALQIPRQNGHIPPRISGNNLIFSVTADNGTVMAEIFDFHGKKINTAFMRALSSGRYSCPVSLPSHSPCCVRLTIDNTVYHLVSISFSDHTHAIRQPSKRLQPRMKKSAMPADTLHVTKNGYNEKKVPLPSLTATIAPIVLEQQPGPMSGMVKIEATGKNFMMGAEDSDGQSNEQPVHKVTFTYDYWIGIQEVNQKEFTEEAGDDYTGGEELPWISYHDAGAAKGATDPAHPVWHINWFGAVRYCNILSKNYDLDTVYSYTSHSRNAWSRDEMSGVEIDYSKDGFRLPTEAEWEYAYRGGTDTKYFWGDDESAASEYCHFGDKTKGTAPCGSLKPNPFGLYDMGGNSAEWCNDWLGEYPSGEQQNPTGPSSGQARVLRGGSWRHPAKAMRSALRFGQYPYERHHCAGGFQVYGDGYERPGLRIARGVIQE